MARASSIFLVVAAACMMMMMRTKMVESSDPELLTDYAIPEGWNASSIDANFFTFTKLRQPASAPSADEEGFKPMKVSVAEFPALMGLGVSLALLSFQPDALNPPHTHPRATELLYVLQGSLNLGLVDSAANNHRLFSQTLQQGDVFVFPKGLLHFQHNPSSSQQTLALSAFSSASPGLLSLPKALFASGIPSHILQKAFYASADLINQLEAPFQKKY